MVPTARARDGGAAGRLNPVLHLPDGPFVMVTQAAAAIDIWEIKSVGISLAHAEATIMNALAMLLTGY